MTTGCNMMYTQQVTLIMAIVRSAINNSLYVLLIISLLCEYDTDHYNIVMFHIISL